MQYAMEALEWSSVPYSTKNQYWVMIGLIAIYNVSDILIIFFQMCISFKNTEKTFLICMKHLSWSVNADAATACLLDV